MLTSSCLLPVTALAKDDGGDEDMAEMIQSEIKTLSDQLKDLEEKIKVCTEEHSSMLG